MQPQVSGVTLNRWHSSLWHCSTKGSRVISAQHPSLRPTSGYLHRRGRTSDHCCNSESIIKPRVQLWTLNCSCPGWWHPANVLNQNVSGELISNVEVLVYISEWCSSLAMIGVGLSVLYFGVSVRSFNQNLVEFRTQSGPHSMMHFYVQVCAGTDLLHSDSENFCSEELAEALRGTLKVRNLLCCSACFLWFSSRRTWVSSVAFQWLIIGIATDGRNCVPSGER